MNVGTDCHGMISLIRSPVPSLFRLTSIDPGKRCEPTMN